MDSFELFKGVDYVEINGTLPSEILDITNNSKEMTKGSLFICEDGHNTSGKNYVSEAERKGCSIIVSCEKLQTSVCNVVVSDVKAATAKLAKNFYGNPQEDMRIIGVVGTNGKTSVSHILSAILKERGYEVGVIGTIGTYYKGEKIESNLTTPDCLSLYKTIYRMASLGIDALVMEISAHAISQRRTEGLYFHSLIFTNCTEDHLDYFENMQRYAQVKKSIFCSDNCRYMVVNSDDELGRDIINSNSKGVISYGIENPADVFAINVNENKNGISYVINLFDVIYDINCKLLGKVNVYNTLAACACSATLGANIYDMANALKKMTFVEGRGELVATVRGATVIVDYAHTPDGLLKTLSSLKKICKGKLYCLFGCGGNREKEKRAKMGEISGKLADFTILTSDNPRFEDECEIIRQIERGVKRVTLKYITVKDRKTAICYALDRLSGEDVLLIAGKGAERYQEILGERRYFSDKDEVMRYQSKTEA